MAGYDGGAEEGEGDVTDRPTGFSVMPSVMTGGGEARKAFGE